MTEEELIKHANDSSESNSTMIECYADEILLGNIDGGVSKLDLLFEKFCIPQDDNKWSALAIKMAIYYEPEFHKKSTGRREYWHPTRLFALWLNVQIKLQSSKVKDISHACRILSNGLVFGKTFSKSTLQNKYTLSLTSSSQFISDFKLSASNQDINKDSCLRNELEKTETALLALDSFTETNNPQNITEITQSRVAGIDHDIFLEKLITILGVYGIDPLDKDCWIRLTYSLAYEYIPGFSFAKESGMEKKWTPVQLFKLWLLIEIKKCEHGDNSIESIIGELITKGVLDTSLTAESYAKIYIKIKSDLAALVLIDEFEKSHRRKTADRCLSLNSVLIEVNEKLSQQ